MYPDYRRPSSLTHTPEVFELMNWIQCVLLNQGCWILESPAGWRSNRDQTHLKQRIKLLLGILETFWITGILTLLLWISNTGIANCYLPASNYLDHLPPSCAPFFCVPVSHADTLLKSYVYGNNEYICCKNNIYWQLNGDSTYWDIYIYMAKSKLRLSHFKEEMSAKSTAVRVWQFILWK